MKSIHALCFFLFVSIFSWGQNPQLIPFPADTDFVQNAACQDQFAGTINFENFVGQSNDVTPDTIYFCLGDQINIAHNGDADLSGDPNPFSVAGVTYAFLTCPPSISGPNLTSILDDPCLLNDPPPVNGIYVTGGGSINGDIFFKNTGSMQNIFNDGGPLQLWFAPITIDNFATKQFEADAVSGEVGPCVHLNVDEAFSVVYLNEIVLDSFSVDSNCVGQISVSGGLPEFDGSNYSSISIELVTNPSVTGTVLNSAIGHGDIVEFVVPVPGIYNINVEDEKSCGSSLLANMTNCASLVMDIQNPIAIDENTFCVDVVHQNGFTDLVAVQCAIAWDTSILSFSSVENLTANLPDFSAFNSISSLNETLVLAWASFGGMGQTLPPGEVLFQVCFDVDSSEFGCTSIEYTSPNGSIIEVVNEDGMLIEFFGFNGEICDTIFMPSSSEEKIKSYEINEIKISPNPAINFAFLEFPSYLQLPIHLEYINMDGRILRSEKIETHHAQVQLNDLPPGLYFLRATNGTGDYFFGKILIE